MKLINQLQSMLVLTLGMHYWINIYLLEPYGLGRTELKFTA